MFLWLATYLCLLIGIRELDPLWQKLKVFLSQNREIIALRAATDQLKLLQEMLESGLVPGPEEWNKVKLFPKPWGEILFASLSELRAQGAAVLPSLHRMQKTLDEQVEFIQEAKVKSSQAFGQAILGIVLVPIFSLVLYLLMPGIDQSTQAFILLSLIAFLWSSIAFIWMMSMSDRARYGNMRTQNRRWLVSVNSTIERILALISTGLPPDLAWRKAMEELSLYDLELVKEWKLQVWDADFAPGVRRDNECERLILGVGIEIRKSIQTSLIEGRPCMDRIESIQQAFLLDLRARVSKELNLLPQRCLKPLFICVLPSVFLLMMGTFALSIPEFQ